MGYFHRTETNKMIAMIGDASNKAVCRTEFDTTDKGINPMGGWVNYGLIKTNFVMIIGSCPGTKKRTVILRDAVEPHKNFQVPKIQWICTSSKIGHGMFETSAEKAAFFGKTAKV